MTQPAPELTSKPIGGETTTATVAGAPERDLFYVRSPVTGDTRGVTREQAAELVFRSGWEPVVEPAAERLLQRQLLREGASPWSAAAYGAARGLTGGLVEYGLPQGDDPGAMALQAIRDEHPVISTGAEIAGTAVPFLGAMRGLKLLSLPGLAESAGAGATRLLAGTSPGVARSIAARAVGMGLEGGAQGVAYNAGESAIEDTPLTAQKLASGFLMGAGPGAILGAPIGAAEGLLSRYGLKGGLLREHLVRPGVDDLDLMQIAQREHGVAVPGLSDELAANMSGVSPELVKMSGDNGPIGQQIREELQRAPELRVAAEGKAAEALNQIRDIDELAISGVAGRMKEEQVRKWIPSGGAEAATPDAEAAVMDALRADSAEEVASRGAKTIAPGAAREEDELGLAAARDAEPSPQTPELANFSKFYMTPELQGMRDDWARATGRMERQNIEEAALEKYGDDAARYVRGDERSQLNLPKRDPIPSRGQVATIEFAPGREGELARAARAGKMADIISSWASDSPEVAASLRNGLAAGSSQSSLRKAIRRALGNADENFLEVFRAAHTSASDSSKAALGKRLLDAGHSPVARGQSWKAHAIDVVDELALEADALATQAKGVVGKKASHANEILDLMTSARAKIVAGDKAQAFVELDYLKKRLGKYAAPGEYLGTDQNVAAMARRQYEDLRTTLENSSLWGEKAATAQRDINRIFAARINRADAFWDRFFVDSGKAHPDNPWIRQREATGESVRKGLDGIIDPKASREYQAFQQHINESRDVLANLKKHYALSGDDAGKIAQWTKAVDDAERTFKEATYYARREAQAKALFGNNAKLVPGWGKWVAMHFLGPAGFLAAAAAERATNPGARIYARAVLERTLRQSESRVASAVTKLLTGKGIRLQGFGVTQLAAKASVSLFRDKPEKRKEGYRATLRELAQLSTPEMARQHVQKSMPFAVATLPMFGDTLAAQTTATAQYILSRAPQQPRWTPQGTIVDQPSDTELYEFESLMRAAMDPVSVFEDAANGEPVTQAAVTAAEDLAPELMDHVRLLVMDELTNGGHKISYHRSIALSRVIGVDLDPTLEPGYINTQQMIYAARAQSGPNPSANRSTGEEDGVNEGYRDLRMPQSDKIESGVPPK